MAYVTRARFEGAGRSAAAVEEILELASAALSGGLHSDYLLDEQVIEVSKGEPDGDTRYRGRRVVFFDLSEQAVRAPVPGANFRA